MVLRKPLEMRLNGTGDLLGILDGEKVADKLSVVFGLSRKTERRIPLFTNFQVAHHLNNLCRWGKPVTRGRIGWDLAVHQSGLGVEFAEQGNLKWIDLRPV